MEMLNRFINLIRSLLMRDKVVNFQSSSVYDEEIKNKEKNLEIFHDVVGDSPLNHIDWIIENGLEKFNQLYRSCEDGSIGKRQLLNNYKEHKAEIAKYPQEKYHTKESMSIGYIKGSREEKAADELLRQSLSARDHRTHSSANQIQMKNDISPSAFGELIRKFENDECIHVVDLRGGIGNEVVFRYEEVHM